MGAVCTVMATVVVAVGEGERWRDRQYDRACHGCEQDLSHRTPPLRRATPGDDAWF
jgi:hypothetical protein